MKAMIRRAKPEDADAIAMLAADALATPIDAESARLRRLLGDGLTFAAALDEALVGFADSFITVDRNGRRRFELDLLAVAPHIRGRGLGGRLVAASLAAASASDSRLIRALVRADNRPMRQLCRRHGFAQAPGNCELFVAAPRPVVWRRWHHNARLIPVETLSYSGIWLEGELNQDAIDNGHWTASQKEMTIIGALIPAGTYAVAELLQANDFECIGEYNWWTINRGSD